MKIQVCQYVLVVLASLFISSEWALCADNTPPNEATPGSPAATDTKTQINDPSGPSKQKTAAVPPDTKKVMNDPSGPNATGVNKSGAKATKKPQKEQQPSTSNP
jgi:hypothetical protein